MFWLFAATTFAASLVSGLSGFGFGLIAMAVLPLLVSIKLANAFVSFAGLAIFTTLTIPLRKHITWKALIPLLVGAALGVPVGIYGLVSLNENVLLKILAAFIMSYVAFTLLVQNRVHFRMDRRWGYLAGFIGGIISGSPSTVPSWRPALQPGFFFFITSATGGSGG